METTEAKRLIDDLVDYEETKRLLVKLVQTPSPQTDLLENEPQVLSLIRDVVKPELAADGIDATVDPMGNLIARMPGTESGRGPGTDRLRHERDAEHHAQSLFWRDR